MVLKGNDAEPLWAKIGKGKKVVPGGLESQARVLSGPEGASVS